MKIVYPVNKQWFEYANDELFFRCNTSRGTEHFHRRATLPEIYALFNPLPGQKHLLPPSKHWLRAQLVHYGLPLTDSKETAIERFREAFHKCQLSVPEYIKNYEAEFRSTVKETKKRSRHAEPTRCPRELQKAYHEGQMDTGLGYIIHPRKRSSCVIETSVGDMHNDPEDQRKRREVTTEGFTSSTRTISRGWGNHSQIKKLNEDLRFSPVPTPLNVDVINDMDVKYEWDNDSALVDPIQVAFDSPAPASTPGATSLARYSQSQRTIPSYWPSTKRVSRIRKQDTAVPREQVPGLTSGSQLKITPCHQDMIDKNFQSIALSLVKTDTMTRPPARRTELKRPIANLLVNGLRSQQRSSMTSRFEASPCHTLATGICQTKEPPSRKKQSKPLSSISFGDVSTDSPHLDSIDNTLNNDSTNSNSCLCISGENSRNESVDSQNDSDSEDNDSSPDYNNSCPVSMIKANNSRKILPLRISRMRRQCSPAEARQIRNLRSTLTVPKKIKPKKAQRLGMTPMPTTLYFRSN